jgi:predicted metal-dependent peptidase
MSDADSKKTVADDLIDHLQKNGTKVIGVGEGGEVEVELDPKEQERIQMQSRALARAMDELPSKSGPLTSEDHSLLNQALMINGLPINPVPWKSVYNIDEFLTKMYMEEPYYGSLLMNTQRVMTRDVPTMCVTWSSDLYYLLVNPDFIGKIIYHCEKFGSGKAEERLDQAKHFIISVLMHEFNHISLGHVTFRSKTVGHGEEDEDLEMDELINWVMDMANNSLLEHENRKLPVRCIVPGLRPGYARDEKIWPDDIMTQEIKKTEPDELDKAVMDAPQLESTEQYYSRLRPHWSKYKKKPVSGFKFSDHTRWPKDMTPQEQEYAKALTRQMILSAIHEAENRGWGSMSASMQALIRAQLEPQIDWRDELKEWVGLNAASHSPASTWRKNSRKFPGVHPGRRKQTGLRAAFCCDQSGSVSTEMIDVLGSEALGIGEVASVTFIPFDETVDEEHVTEFDSNSVQLMRTRCGGTNFEAPTLWVNERAEDFDIVIFGTDGECSAPSESRLPRIWLIAPGKKLNFETSEKVINLPDTYKRQHSPLDDIA